MRAGIRHPARLLVKEPTRGVYNEGMKRSLRTAVGVLILIVSLALLAWGLWPVQRERRVLPVEPSNLTLPTPSSFIPTPFGLA